MISLFFRYDDFSAVSPVEVDTGLAAALARHRCPVTFGVIPAITSGEVHVAGDRPEFPLEGAKVDWLASQVAAGGVELALHGWNHRTNHLCPAPTPSEYRGLALDQQIENLRRGVDRLQRDVGVRPLIFIPPWNSYDSATVAAVAASGFTVLSAARTGAAPRDARLVFLPTCCELHDLESTLMATRESGDEDAIIGVLMHPYDFTESGDGRARFDLPALEALLDRLTSAPDVRLRSIGTLAASPSSVGADRFRANRPSGVDAVAPAFARGRRRTWYASLDTARRARRRLALVTVAYYAALAGANWVLGNWLARLVPESRVAVIWSLAGLLLAGIGLVALRAIRSGRLYARGMVALSSQGGFLSALIPW